MKHIMARGNPAPHRAKRGSALVEYILLTGVSVGALLLPFGDDNQSVIKRLTEAVRKDHSGYMYMAGLPSLPRTDTLAGGLPGTDPGGNAPPGEGPNPTPPVAAPGPGTEPQPGLPGGPLPLPGPGLPLPVGGPVTGPDTLPVSVPLPAVPPIGVPGGPVIVGPAPVGGPGTGPAPVVTLPTEVPLPTLPVSPPGGGGGDTPNPLPRFPQPGTPGPEFTPSTPLWMAPPEALTMARRYVWRRRRSPALEFSRQAVRPPRSRHRLLRVIALRSRVPRNPPALPPLMLATPFMSSPATSINSKLI